jgi:hypothetical protein
VGRVSAEVGEPVWWCNTVGGNTLGRVSAAVGEPEYGGVTQ